MIKRLVCSAAVAGLVMLPGAPAAHADQAAVDDTVRDSLVYVGIQFTGWVHIPPGVADPTESVWSDQTTVNYSCTGFVVDPAGFIATAGHCVDVDADVKQAIREQFVVDAVKAGKLDQVDAESFLDRANREAWAVEGKEEGAPVDRVVQVIQPNNPGRVIDSFTTAQVVDIQKFDDGDNAVLKVSGVGELKPLVIAKSAPKPGQALTSVGFPGSVESVVDPTRLQQPSFKSGTASSQQVKPSGASVTEINADVSGGMSGGPTINNDNGEVLGINSYGIVGEEQAFNFITDAPTLRSFLQKNGVSLAEPAPAKKSFPWLWVGIGIAVVVVVAVVLVLLMVMKGKKGPKSPAAAPAMVGSMSGASYPPPGGGQPYTPPPSAGPTYTPPPSSGQSYPPPPPSGQYPPPPPSSGPTYPMQSSGGPSYPPPPGQAPGGQEPPSHG